MPRTRPYEYSSCAPVQPQQGGARQSVSPHTPSRQKRGKTTTGRLQMFACFDFLHRSEIICCLGYFQKDSNWQCCAPPGFPFVRERMRWGTEAAPPGDLAAPGSSAASAAVAWRASEPAWLSLAVITAHCSGLSCSVLPGYQENTFPTIVECRM